MTSQTKSSIAFNRLPDHTQLPESEGDTNYTPITDRPPDHTQLPDEDGTFVKNFQEHPQSILLTDSITPLLQQRHQDNQYCIGQDCGIYWRLTEPTDKGAEAPDWFYVPNVSPLVDGQIRRSYVMWYEVVAPLIVIEFVSRDGSEERDATPKTGKFWVYEQAIRVPFYAIYEVSRASVEVYQLLTGNYQLLPPNDRGHYPIGPLGVELGIWQGQYQNAELPWLRFWDEEGNLLLTGGERAEQEGQRADREQQEKELAQQQAEQERQRADRLAAQLRALGIDPEA
ncbi:Uma2 family endonuclease [Microcoleus sp. N3A4]|uniref:Uma2 family endonuclease n=1 Tax=Microcoleus sp. N3A4 TaxID=3055379 RepID=UPI002FD48BA5